MTIADELSRLQDLHTQGALTDAEFAQAKAALLASYSRGRGAAQEARPSASLDDIHFQNELARLDREWELEREKLMVTGRSGGRHIPSEGISLIFAVIAGVFGIFWTFLASYSQLSFLPVIGVVFTLLMVGMCISGFIKAGEYRKAEQEYQDRRAKLLAQRPSTKYDVSKDRIR